MISITHLYESKKDDVKGAFLYPDLKDDVARLKTLKKNKKWHAAKKARDLGGQMKLQYPHMDKMTRNLSVRQKYGAALWKQMDKIKAQKKNIKNTVSLIKGSVSK